MEYLYFTGVIKMAIDSIKIEEIQPDGTKKEILGTKDPANGYHNYLVMFNALIDLDFAILRMIQAEYNNPSFIDQKIMNMTTQQVKSTLINREDPNPVTICIKDKQIADSIYKEIMTTRYQDLLKEDKYMAITGIFFLISVYTAMDNVNVTVVCSNQREKEIIEKYHSKINVMIPESLDMINVNDYTEFIFKNKNDVFKFKQVFDEKRVLLLKYRFNVSFDENIPVPDTKLSFALWNSGYSKTALVDVYSREDEDYATLKVVKKKPTNK